MVVVSDTSLENLNRASLQFLQFSSMIASETIVNKKLKIKFGSKRIEGNPKTESCEFGQRLSMNNECVHTFPVTQDKESGMGKPPKLKVQCCGNEKLYSADNLKFKSSAMGSRKRVLPGIEDGQKEKRRKMDRIATQQCHVILKELMSHPSGWPFKHPVDPVFLKIPDYFSIITEPMDLGTIKTKLRNNVYSSVDEFAAHVKLTFSNAMLYNPLDNPIHHMAKNLNELFNTRWNNLEEKWNRGCTNVEKGHTSNGSTKNTSNTGQKVRKASPFCVALVPDRLMSPDQKQKLRKQLLELSREKMPPNLQGFFQRVGFNCHSGERIEVDIDAFDEDTLWELKRITSATIGARAVNAEPAKRAENCREQSLVSRIVRKGSDSGNRSGSSNVNPPLTSVSYKCGSCGSMRCQCHCQSDYARASSVDLSSERAVRQDHVDAARGIHYCESKSLAASEMSKSDPDSNGSASALDDEHISTSPQLSTLATSAVSGDEWTHLIDVQLSPKKALRAAILKSRFADTILKAKQKTLLDNGDKADPVKMQQEKKRLERQQLEEKARIEAQIRAAEEASRMKAEADLKMQREREREDARLALQKMEKSVDIVDNLEILKDLEMLRGCSPSDLFCGSEEGLEMGLHGNPLERLGLFIKHDFIADEDEEAILNGDGEEGEICS